MAGNLHHDCFIFLGGAHNGDGENKDVSDDEQMDQGTCHFTFAVAWLPCNQPKCSFGVILCQTQCDGDQSRLLDRGGGGVLGSDAENDDEMSDHEGGGGNTGRRTPHNDPVDNDAAGPGTASAPAPPAEAAVAN